MTIVEDFQDLLAREMQKMSSGQVASLEEAMAGFDRLLKAGAIEPDRYCIEPIGEIYATERFTSRPQ